MIEDRIQDWAERSLGALVLERPGRSVALEHFGLDYCCGGKERLATACERKGLELGTVIAALERVDASPEREDLTWQASPLMAINHIVSTHHAYTKEALPRLQRLTQRVARVHGLQDPRLVTLEASFETFALETLDHMDKEERMLFPMIQALSMGERWPLPPTVQFPINCMLREHDQHAAHLEAFRALTDGYVPPENACGTWRALLDGLQDLEQDLHRHIHKENSFLFPLAIELEQAAS